MSYTLSIRHSPTSLLRTHMDYKDTTKGQYGAGILLYNEDYFKYVFKKTEKIISAVFYTTRSLNDIGPSDTVIGLLEDKSKTLLEAAEKTLRAPETSRRLRIEELRIRLIGLESALTVASGAQIIPFELLEVFRHELNSVHRSLKDYDTEGNKDHPLGRQEATPYMRARARSPQAMRDSALSASTSTTRSAPESQNRRERILSIIKDKGQASIKDVSTVITDCSEKTIQRELMSLISEGQIKKDGERRWSRYSLVG